MNGQDLRSEKPVCLPRELRVAATSPTDPSSWVQTCLCLLQGLKFWTWWSCLPPLPSSFPPSSPPFPSPLGHSAATCWSSGSHLVAWILKVCICSLGMHRTSTLKYKKKKKITGWNLPISLWDNYYEHFSIFFFQHFPKHAYFPQWKSYCLWTLQPFFSNPIIKFSSINSILTCILVAA